MGGKGGGGESKCGSPHGRRPFIKAGIALVASFYIKCGGAHVKAVLCLKSWETSPCGAANETGIFKRALK